jgi:hypothetical protein
MPLSTAGNQAEGNMNAPMMVILGLFAVTLPLGALVVGLLALRSIETQRDVSGRWLALTGTITGGLGVLWCVVVYAAIVFKQSGL